MASSWYILAFLFVAAAMTQCSILNFGHMIHKVTGKNALSYAFYGCYCGIGGYGYPRDNTDGCCHTHDCCYKHLEQIGCKPKTKDYKFHVVHGNVLCGDRKNDFCAIRSCQCDSMAAICFQVHRSSYSPTYAFYAKPLKCKDPKLHCSMYKF
uniref:Phospholipase A2 n=1 Tax=Leptobrachium leishanense TaxID=445787 RepID=A0A8C5Q7C1_9ANUR